MSENIDIDLNGGAPAPTPTPPVPPVPRPKITIDPKEIVAVAQEVINLLGALGKVVTVPWLADFLIVAQQIVTADWFASLIALLVGLPAKQREALLASVISMAKMADEKPASLAS